ncbi:MAG: ATP-dependent sacrificial sulfur transferase LarE [Elusimicrobia bacterium]|nr:ATP-dependent sacrificial sulfur transferase LarE [Elusimicrobiota bacterium]
MLKLERDLKFKKLESLKRLLKKYKKILVAFSGGVDSAFLLKVAVDTLGKENVISVTAISPTYPENDLKIAKQIVGKYGNKNFFIKTGEMNNKKFVCNTKDRCFWCKNELFRKIHLMAKNNNIDVVCDGTNYSDKNDYRPGMLAAKKWNVRHPLLETKILKQEIRDMSRKFNLSTWNKDASPCIASRLPYGSKITKYKIERIKNAENELRKYKLRNLRIRDYSDTARIEVDEKQFRHIFNSGMYKKIVEILKKYKYTFITLDLEGYRTGSLNKVIKNKTLNH